MPKSKAVVKKESADVENLTAEEKGKIDEAVKFINKQGDATARSLIDIGQYLLKTFFDNDIKKVEDRGPRKGISLRKIAAHPEIMFSYKSLHNAAHLAYQENIFKDEKYRGLSATHKLLLFSIKDTKKKKSYADMVIKEGLSVNNLRKKLIEAEYILPRGRAEGMPRIELEDPFDAFIKSIEQIEGLTIPVDMLDINQLTNDHVQSLNELKRNIETLIARFDKIHN